MLSLVNRMSAAGMAIVVVVGLALAAIVEEAVLPVGADHRLGADHDHAGTKARKTHATRHPRPKPVSPTVLLNRQVQKVAAAQRGPTAKREYGVKTVATPVVRLSRADRKRTWAFGTAAIPPPRGMTAMPESALYLAHGNGKSWQVALSGTAGFADLLRRAPASVLPPAERTLLARFNTAAKAAKAAKDTGLMLPWSVGQSWSLLATDTGAAGFDGGDGRVLAAGDGRLYRFCSSAPDRGLILIIHPNGLATEYYQIDQVTPIRDGGEVKRGDYLGRTSTDQPCDDAPAPQRLARFTVRNAAGLVPLDTVQVGGWTLHETPTGTFAQRDGKRVEAGNLLPNLGVGTAPVPMPSGMPTGISGMPSTPPGDANGGN